MHNFNFLNTIRKLRINKSRIKTSRRSSPIGCKIDKNNLVYAKITNNQDEEVVENIRIATLNARLVRNKDHDIVQELHDSSVAMAVLTKTWPKDTEVGNSWLNQLEIKQCNYDILMQNRPGPKTGRGIALIYKHEYNNYIKLLKKHNNGNGIDSLQTHP